MKKTSVSSPTESGCTGQSRPVIRKGVVKNIDLLRIREAPSAMSQCLVGIVEGSPVEILTEIYGFYKVRWCGGGMNLVGYVPSNFIQEVTS